MGSWSHTEGKTHHKDEDQKKTQDSTCQAVPHASGPGIHQTDRMEGHHYAEAERAEVYRSLVVDGACKAAPEDEVLEQVEAEEDAWAANMEAAEVVGTADFAELKEVAAVG